MSEDVDSDVEEDSFKAIKMTLNQICPNFQLKNRINEFVLNANKIMFESYALANLHITRLLTQNQPLPLLDQTFFQNCSRLVSRKYEKTKSGKIDPDIQTTFNLYSQCRPVNYNPAFADYNAVLISYIVKDMIVSTKNHLILNFYSRMRKYIRHKYNLDGSKAYTVLKHLYTNHYDGDDLLVKELRNKLNNLPPNNKSLNSDPTFILKVYNEILTYFKENNLEPENKALRTFSLLPNKNSFTISNITIDKTVLKDILLSFKKKGTEDEMINSFINKTNNEIVQELQQKTKENWKLFFNIKKINDFAGIIKTDGKNVSLLYEKKREKVKKTKKNLKGCQKEKQDYDYTNIKLDDYDIVRTADPGFRFPYKGTSSLEKKKNDTIQCSSKRYYNETKMTEATKKKQVIYKKSEYITSFFKGIPSNKTNIIEEYLEYLKYTLPCLTQVLKFHFDKPFRKLKFTTYIFKQKTMNKLCQEITGKKHRNDTSIKALIGFGDWSAQKDSIIKGHARGPVVALKRELKKWCKVISINEYNTSKLCCRCHSKTENVYFNNIKVNNVLRCLNNECRIVIDRDINACNNQYFLMINGIEGKERPKVFCPDKNE